MNCGSVNIIHLTNCEPNKITGPKDIIMSFSFKGSTN